MEPTLEVRCQGRTVRRAELQNLQTLIDTHPEWSRHRVGVELCERGAWRTAQGVLKTYAARELLLKLEALQPLVWERADYGRESRRRALSYLRSCHYLGGSLSFSQVRRVLVGWLLDWGQDWRSRRGSLAEKQMKLAA